METKIVRQVSKGMVEVPRLFLVLGDLVKHVQGLGLTYLIAFFIPLCLLCLFGFAPAFFPILIGASILLMLLGGLFALVCLLLMRQAIRLYRRGAEDRLRAFWAMARAQKIFMRAHGVLWAAVLLALGWACLKLLGLTLLSYLLAGSLIGVACANLAGSIFARPSIFRLLCCKQQQVPARDAGALVRYALEPNARLAQDMVADGDGLASSLAVAQRQQADANSGTHDEPLRLEAFGHWPGLGLLRETRLRMRAALLVAFSGAFAGLVAAIAVLLLFDLQGRSTFDETIFDWSRDQVGQVGESNSAQSRNASGANADATSDLSGGKTGSAGIAASGGPSSHRSGQDGGSQASAQQSATGGQGQPDGQQGNGGDAGENASPSSSSNDAAASEQGGGAETGEQSGPGDAKAGEQAGAQTVPVDGAAVDGPQTSASGDEVGSEGQAGAGAGQGSAQGLTDKQAAFPQGRDGQEPLTIATQDGTGRGQGNGKAGEQAPISAEGADHGGPSIPPPESGGNSGTGAAGKGGSAVDGVIRPQTDPAKALRDERTGFVGSLEGQGLAMGQRSGVYAGRGAKPVQSRQIRTTSVGDAKKLPPKPHIPVQYMPQWMKAILQPNQ